MCPHSGIMRLKYEQLQHPFPIHLNIGTLRKPTLGEIYKDIDIEVFNYYEAYLTMTVEDYYLYNSDTDKREYWDSLNDNQKQEIGLYDIVKQNNSVCDTYTKIFNIFFEESVIFINNAFILYQSNGEQTEHNITADKVVGIINEQSFEDVLDIICQTCCIERQSGGGKIKFKNALARKLYERMKLGNKQKKKNGDMTLSNIISAVTARHTSLNYTTIYQLTIFQLMDNFERLRVNEIYDSSRITVSVWGDKKKHFDDSLWYKKQHKE